MKVLLDSHTFLWFVLDDAQLSPYAKALIEDAASDVFISPASFGEIAIKVRLGKLDLQASYDDFMQRGIVGNAFAILPIEPRPYERPYRAAASPSRSIRSALGGPGNGRANDDRKLRRAT
jgi:PIN domain nuclease of toxin-antitoxin system